MRGGLGTRQLITLYGTCSKKVISCCSLLYIYYHSVKMHFKSLCIHLFLSPHQTIGSEESQGLADFGVIKYYGWKKVTIFQLDVDSFEIVRLSGMFP